MSAKMATRERTLSVRMSLINVGVAARKSRHSCFSVPRSEEEESGLCILRCWPTEEKELAWRRREKNDVAKRTFSSVSSLSASPGIGHTCSDARRRPRRRYLLSGYSRIFARSILVLRNMATGARSGCRS